MFRKYFSIIVVALLGIGTAFFFYKNTLSEKRPTSLPDDFVLIAHRGASAYAPEHTLPAFQMAYDLNADYLEIDLQQTKDGELVILHDETLDRTTDGTGRVSDFTYEELKTLDAGTWFNEAYPDKDKAYEQFEGLPIIRLETLFQEYGLNANYYIETKSPEIYPYMEENLLNLLDQYHLLDDAGDAQKLLLQSFSEESLQKIHQLNPEISLI
ncbi:glycerophosphodiester phosphodiesterase family protein [Marinilactibacillus sp. GCM10026970]|uniref:glycerophosphodiester phosphodiesterase family protein n=1 Tax=Marinilactibacillus sp. GCM10026970 TaxID=3252642 RepID=UPI0036141D57